MPADVQVSVYGPSNEVERCLTFATDMLAARVQIWLTDGTRSYTLTEAAGVDLLGDWEKAWLNLNGYPEGYPCDCQCTVDKDGIELEFHPCS